MKAFTSLFLMVLVVLLSSCNSKPKQAEVPVIDLTKVTDETDFSLADVADNFRLVALETTENCVLGPGRLAIGDKYIVVCSQEGRANRLKLFTAKGDYIRQIYDYGKGPEEYLFIQSITLSADESKLYYNDVGGKEIVQVNLEEDLKRTVIPMTRDYTMIIFLPVEDDHFFTFSMNDSLMAVEQDASGRILHTYKGHQEPEHDMSGTLLFFKPGKEVFFYPSIRYGDTLYSLKEGTVYREFAIYGGPAADMSDPNPIGFSSGPRTMFTDYILFFRREEKFSKEGMAMRISDQSYTYYVMERSNNKLQRITSIANPVTGTDIPVDEGIHMIVDYGTGKLVYVWTALEFKALVASADPDAFHPDFREQILEIDRNLKEDDNPVLLIGDLR